ncbi:MAG: hypothetical protein IJS96_07240 [Schwartzia sp.]|nr:hypothetical protein [Schwartzia sp. (in: firmicutes)]
MDKKLLFSKLLLLLAQAALFFPFAIHPTRNGLDPSWQYELNLIPGSGLVFGRDLLFNYGPLGYLFLPQPIGDNVFWSWLVLGALCALTLGSSAYVLFSPRFAAVNGRWANILAAALLIGTAELVGVYDPEYWITGTVLFLFAATLREKRLSWLFRAALGLVVFFFFVKFSTGILNVISAVLFVLAAFLQRRPDARKIAAAVVLGLPLGFAAAYLLYHPSLEDMARYAYAAMNISSGYNYNMSLPVTDTFYLRYIWGLLLLLLAGIWYLARRSRENLIYALLFSGPVFVLLKHSFVRGDYGHILFAGPVLFLFAAIYLLFTETSLEDLPWTRLSLTLAAALFSVAVLWPMHRTVYPGSWNVLRPFIDKARLARALPYQFRHIDEIRDQRTFFLTDEFRAAMKGGTMTVYPWEVAYYRQEDDFSFRPLPIFPINSSTPWLDRYNAAFLRGEKAPDFVVLALDAVDNQYPLINCPALWQVILFHYEITGYDGHNFLLRRGADRTPRWNPAASWQARRDEDIVLPRTEDGQRLLMTVDARRNLKGRLAQIFYKIPEITLTVEYDTGETVTRRVFFEVWENGVIIDALPVTDDDFRAIMDGRPRRRVRRLRFGGEGLSCYRDEMTVTLTKLEMK